MLLRNTCIFWGKALDGKSNGICNIYRSHDVPNEYAAETLKIIHVYRLPLTSTQASSLNEFINNKYANRKPESPEWTIRSSQLNRARKRVTIHGETPRVWSLLRYKRDNWGLDTRITHNKIFYGICILHCCTLWFRQALISDKWSKCA